MTKIFTSLLLLSISMTACSAPDTITNLNQVQNQSGISSAAKDDEKQVAFDINQLEKKMRVANPNKVKKNDLNSKGISAGFAQQIASSLDLNKDNSVDASEAPISLTSSAYTTNINNSDNSSITGYTPTKPITVATISDYLTKGFDLVIYGSKTSEKNKAQISSAIAKVLVKDTIGESNKAYGYGITIGYFTGKTTIMVRNMDASLLAKRINEQITVGQGTINGEPYKGANGALVILSSYATIDGKYKSRLNFSNYQDFGSGIQLFGSHKITDAASKIVK